MPPITMLIKPASSQCNLRCEYCFYNDLSTLRMNPSYGMMTLETLENITRKALQIAERYCIFGFQGGEPTLIGLEFFEALIEFQQKYKKSNVEIHNTLQTNGTLLDDNWARFLAKNKFLTGISIDGAVRAHNRFRFDASGEGTLKKTLDAMSLLNKYGANYNVLCVVNKEVARNAHQTYRFFQSKGVHYVQFIPCINPFGEESTIFDYTLTAEDYGEFLKTTFDLWYRDFSTPNAISIRTFDNFVDMCAGYPPESCSLNGFCHGYFLIEGDGTVFPCDFYCLDEYRLGNVNTDSMWDILGSPVMKSFNQSSKHVLPQCNNCEWYKLCRGGCRRHREPFVDGKPGPFRFCESMKMFFNHAGLRLNKMAETVLL